MQMIKKSYIFVFAFIILLVIAYSFRTFKKSDEKVNDRMLKVESVAIHTSAGWGYNILVDHKIFIHQEFIPAITGTKPFLTQEDAMKTADLAIEKLKNGKLPSITKADLIALKISF